MRPDAPGRPPRCCLESRIAKDPHEKGLDRAYWFEWWWRINPGILFIALFALAALLLWSPSYVAFVPLVVIAITFVLGALLATRVPNVHLDEFQTAIMHGEIPIMTDMPRDRIAGIEDLVRRRHPEATSGGACWMTAAFQ